MPRGIKAMLKRGQPLIGTYVTFPSPEVVELLAAAGMDYVVIDLQHSSPDWQTLAHMIRAADARGIAPIVRTHDHHPSILLKILELGAEGISLPGVKSASDIRAAVDAVYYPPIGCRGACGHTRAGGYNSRRSEFAEHVRRQHERVFIWALIEEPDAIANIGEIAAVRPGADVISVGRGDLSTTLGLHGQINHPHVIAAAEQVIGEVKRHSRGECASAIMIHHPDEVSPWLAKGCSMFTYAADAIMLIEAARTAVEAFRASIAHEKRDMPGEARHA
jgi:4-hydroxy-2-oxoheptanedioate aldolase